MRQEWALAVFCTCIAGVALLYNVFGAPDVLYDEAAYTYAAQQVAQGWHLTLETTPFFVHPPLPFLMEAAWLRITRQSGAALPTAIHAARILAASVGMLDVLLVANLTFQLTADASARRRRVLTGSVALLTALDPVLARYDRQNVIEPFALCASLIALNAAWTLRSRSTLVYVSATGLLIGFALLSNQITIFLVVVPLIHTVLERDRRLVRRAVAALAVGLGFMSTFLLWAIELGLGMNFINVQTLTLQRLIGIVQITGLNMPGVSLAGSLERSVAQYSSSYIAIMVGSLALVWCWTRRNNERGKFLTAWLTASYAFGAYIVGVGTLNEQFFVYLLPATIVGTVIFGDAIMSDWSCGILRRSASRGSYRCPRLPIAVAMLGCAVITCISAASWVKTYSTSSDGVIQVDHVIATQMPACTVVNASGDPEKYSYLLNRRYFSAFSVGPAALADGVHYFILAPIDAIERTGNMSPALEAWIQANGNQLYNFPSATYKSVQLWYVPASPYDPIADIQDIAGGVYVSTVGSDCGYTVTDSKLGSFYSGYQRLGGKSMLGDPLGQPVTVGGSDEQFFDGAVLATSAHGGPSVQAVPIVAELASKSPAAYRKAGLPVVVSSASTATRRSWLTNSAITRAYLGGLALTQSTYDAAVARYGEPLGPPAALAGGTVGQAFADLVLEVSPGQGSVVHAASVTQDVLTAKLLSLPPTARTLQAGPSLGPNPLTPPPTGPTSVEPFVLTLGAAIAVFSLAVLTQARRRRGRVLPAATGSQRRHTEMSGAEIWRSAIGGGGRLPRKFLRREALGAVILAILLLATKYFVAAREVRPDPLAALPGGRTIVAGMDIGGVPSDDDMLALSSTSYQVNGLVNLAGPSVEQQVTASSLHLSYLSLPLAEGAAPALAQLRTLTSFMSSHAVGGNSVYVYDDDGGDRAVTTAAMLLLLKGMPWPTVRQAVSVAELSTLDRQQSAAISQLISALSARGKPAHGNPYAGAEVVAW